MTMPSDAEQDRLTDELEANHWQRVSRDVIDALNQANQAEEKITTGRLSPHIVSALRKLGVEQKLKEHDARLKEHDGFIASVKRGLSGIFKSA